jgi:hypothetical protein
MKLTISVHELPQLPADKQPESLPARAEEMLMKPDGPSFEEQSQCDNTLGPRQRILAYPQVEVCHAT